MDTESKRRLLGQIVCILYSRNKMMKIENVSIAKVNNRMILMRYSKSNFKKFLNSTCFDQRQERVNMSGVLNVFMLI